MPPCNIGSAKQTSLHILPFAPKAANEFLPLLSLLLLGQEFYHKIAWMPTDEI